MESEKNLCSDWCSVPPEILRIIATNLREISDFVRFRAVCKAWRFSTLDTDLPLQFPWIHEIQASGQQNLRFYSPPSNKAFTINVPKASGKNLFASLQGCFLAVLSDRSFPRSYSLINPLKNNELTIPVDFNEGSSFWVGLGYWLNGNGTYGFCYGHYVSDSEHKLLFSSHPGQENWQEFKFNSHLANCGHYCLMGKIFTIETDTGFTKVTNTTTGVIDCVVPPIEGHVACDTVYLTTASKDILRVCQHGDQLSDFANNLSFVIHRLGVNENGSPIWVKVKNIGKHGLFVDYYKCFALMADDLSGIKENCIYVLQTRFFRIDRETGAPRTRYERIDIETGARETLLHPFKGTSEWFAPNLDRLLA